MAIVIYGGGVTEFSGSIGGVTFSRVHSGTVAKLRTKPRHPFSTAASLATQTLAFCSGKWNLDLSDQERIDWNTLAANTTWQNRLGENYSPLGINLYVRANTLLALAQIEEQPVAPAVADEGEQGFTMDYAAPTGIRLTGIDTLTSPPVGTLITWCSGPQRLSAYSWHGPWTLLSLLRIADIALPETLIAPADAVPDRAYWFRWRIVRDNGTISIPWQDAQNTV